MRNVSKLAAVCLSVVALAGQPAIAGSAGNNAAAAAAKDAEMAPTRKAGTKKYCADTESTGSRILQRVCMTEGQWKAQGVDIKATRQ